MEPDKFIKLMSSRVGAPSDFAHPPDRLLELRGILSENEILKPNKNLEGDSANHVMKHGLATLTTIGCLNGFKSFVRRYYMLGSLDSIEAATYPYVNDTGPFSRRGDSGSIIVDSLGKFVALLITNTGSTASFSDVTYGMPIDLLWEVIKAEFPGADLYWDEDN